MRTYDIINAGPNNRFMANGKIVSNSGRLLQTQNLPQNKLPSLDSARAILRSGDFDLLEMLYDNVPDTLSQLIRTALVAVPGQILNVCDFSAIEARVLAYLADEEWRMEVFRTHGRIYEASAAAAFKVPIESVVKGGSLRQKGKVMELACGYGGGIGALKAMDAKWAATQTDEALQEMVTAWRSASPNIVKFWWDVDRAVKEAITYQTTIPFRHGFSFRYEGGNLIIRYPSGRETFYREARIEPRMKFGQMKDTITFMGVDQVKKIWCKQETYGPRLVENCLAEGTEVLTKRGWVPIEKVCLDDAVHDGIQWTQHTGVICQGTQDTISVDGIRMTPEHRLLTTEGWINGEASEGHYWAKTALYDSDQESGVNKGQQAIVVDTLRLRRREVYEHEPLRPRYTEELRLSSEEADRRREQEARHGKTPRVLGLAVYAGSLPVGNTPSMEELWRARHKGMRFLGREFLSILGRYARRLCAGVNPRAERQFFGLLQGELCLGDLHRAGEQHTHRPENKHALGDIERESCGEKIGYRAHHDTESTEHRLAGRITIDKTLVQSQVYDITNAGPRQRFVVKSQQGPVVVHNCAQGFARDCLAVALMRFHKEGINTLFHVHDECVCMGQPEELKRMQELMAAPIAWAPGLPLPADGYSTTYYLKD